MVTLQTEQYRARILSKNLCATWDEWLKLKEKKRQDRIEAFKNRPRIRIKRTKAEMIAASQQNEITPSEPGYLEHDFVNEEALARIITCESSLS